jgi:hypothetical protein
VSEFLEPSYSDPLVYNSYSSALYPHYKIAHAEVMADPGKTREDGERWMAENKARFEAA